MRSQSEALRLVLTLMGFASFALLWLAVVTGFLVRGSSTQSPMRHPILDGIHQAVALIGLSLGATHGVAQLAIPDGSIAALAVIVPFIDPDDRIGLGVGVLGLEIMVVATLSVLIQRRLADALPRALHGLAYGAFMLMVAHVLISDTDVRPLWVQLAVLTAWVMTVILWLTTTSLLGGVGRLLTKRLRGGGDGRDLAVRVDPRRCTASGVCARVAPQVFQLQRDRQLLYRPAVPITQSDVVTRAIEMCPTGAITLAEQSADTSARRSDAIAQW